MGLRIALNGRPAGTLEEALEMVLLAVAAIERRTGTLEGHVRFPVRIKDDSKRIVEIAAEEDDARVSAP